MNHEASSSQYLRALSYRFPTVESALAEIAHLRAVATLPRGTIHVVSDVHGEFQKLEHILRNGSGSLRPLVERVFAGRLDDRARTTLLNLVYYPREAWERLSANMSSVAEREEYVKLTLLREFELLRVLLARYSLRHAQRVFPEPYAELFAELLVSPDVERDPAYADGLLLPYVEDDGGVELLRAAAHALRSFASYELIVAGDLGDRGPRLDRVIDAIRHQRNVTVTWGNHDVEWMGACLGQRALIATVIRISLRYGRIAQLEEGYGLPVEPLELLAREAYADDPAERFRSKGQDLRSPLLLARMQKAAAILQFKLEAQTILRNPHFAMEHRNLLGAIDPQAGTVTIEGRTYPLLDRAFPTVDWSDPYRLSEAEERCIRLMERSFLDSPTLWRDMRYLLERGCAYTTRDENLVFHGCVPVDAEGGLLDMQVDGEPARGRALFDAIDNAVRRAFRDRAQADVDLLYYLWAGARSPMFGKDRMATFETYFVEDKATHKETKNPYFSLIHDPAFCRRMAVEFGVDPERVLIVNGHVPVKVEQGESPLKRSGLAVTIDGAFSEAYGDHGYTLIIDAERTALARHHHFESIDFAIEHGADIVPTVQELRRNDPPRRVGDTARGAELREEVAGLERLVQAYRNHEIEKPPS